MNCFVKVDQLSKHFGHQAVVHQLSFQVAKGQILGFLGPNGAGKSTTLKMLTGYLRPSEGTVWVCGYDINRQPRLAQQHLGYLPEHNPLYQDMYVHEYLQTMGRVRGMKRQQRWARARAVVESCGIEAMQNKKISALSKGYRQRVGLAQALLHEPDVLILDEPTTGLDPNQLREIRALIKTVSSSMAVILSTHIMQEVEALCDQVLIIHQGKKVAYASLDALTASQDGTLAVTFKEPASVAALMQLPGIQAVQPLSAYQFTVRTSDATTAREALFHFAQVHNLTLLGLEQPQSALEALFQQLTTAQEGTAAA